MADQRDQTKKKVFVIGAGMSAESGAPVISQFLQTPFTNLVIGRRLNSLLKFISLAYPEGATPNIEEVLSLIDHAISREETLAGYGSNELRKVKGSLLYVITEVLVKIQDKLLKDLGAEKLDNPYAVLLSGKQERQCIYTQKAMRLAVSMIDDMSGKDKNMPKPSPEAKGWLETYGLLVHLLRPGDTVITFNYDLLLDFALPQSRFKWDIDYGTDFLELTPDTDIMCEGAPLRYYYKPSPGIAKNILTVLKLHGALNWAICSSCKKMVATVLAPLPRVQRYTRELQNDPLDLKKEYLCCPDFNLEPLIVPPTWMKDYNNRYLADIWNVVARQLANSTMIIFLGYSFSESDFQVRALFNKAVSYARTNKPWDKIVVVNKSVDKVLYTYKRFFGEVEPFKGKCSEYLRQITEKQKETKGRLE